MHAENRFTTISRRDFLRLGGGGLASATLLGTTGGRVLAQAHSSLKAQFENAARKYKVPVELLLAMGYYNTLWEMPPPSSSAYRKGDPAGRGDYGIMQLTQNPSRNTLGEAAKLTALQSSTQERSLCQHRGRCCLTLKPCGKEQAEETGWLAGGAHPLRRHGAVRQPGLQGAQGRGLNDHLDR
jgi:hypothetical protein